MLKEHGLSIWPEAVFFQIFFVTKIECRLTLFQITPIHNRAKQSHRDKSSGDANHEINQGIYFLRCNCRNKPTHKTAFFNTGQRRCAPILFFRTIAFILTLSTPASTAHFLEHKIRLKDFLYGDEWRSRNPVQIEHFNFSITIVYLPRMNLISWFACKAGFLQPVCDKI